MQKASSHFVLFPIRVSWVLFVVPPSGFSELHVGSPNGNRSSSRQPESQDGTSVLLLAPDSINQFLRLRKVTQ